LSKILLNFISTLFMIQCRNCDYQQEADNSCIYVNKITHEVKYVFLRLAGWILKRWLTGFMLLLAKTLLLTAFIRHCSSFFLVEIHNLSIAHLLLALKCFLTTIYNQYPWKCIVIFSHLTTLRNIIEANTCIKHRDSICAKSLISFLCL